MTLSEGGKTPEPAKLLPLPPPPPLNKGQPTHQSRPPPPPPPPGGGGKGAPKPRGGRPESGPPHQLPLPPPPPLGLRTGGPQQHWKEPHPLDQSQPSSSSSPPILAPTPSPTVPKPTAPPPPRSAAQPRQQRGRRTQFDFEAYQLKTIFRLSLPASHPLLQIRDAWDLQQGVFALLDEYGLDDHALAQEAFRQGPDIYFRVVDYTAADNLVRARCCLRGSGITILDVLSSKEAAQHRALQPRYNTAIADGQRAQFTRGRLKIDGQWVSA